MVVEAFLVDALIRQEIDSEIRNSESGGNGDQMAAISDHEIRQQSNGTRQRMSSLLEFEC